MGTQIRIPSVLQNSVCGKISFYVFLISQATVLCDIIALNILKRGPFYKENKYLFVTDEDAFQV